MLDANTKRRIDTARDVLVGKVPDPKSQVEQITIALIYKFMDDIDARSEEWGGKRKFFAGDFARYGWARLIHRGLGGHEILNLYSEAIDRMPQNPGIPQLFRDIFENAYLPYRDPQTLRTFLEIIDEFSYDHSERLGDAFEYLLSVLGSQGDAGQFRTPRHIIDFIVAVIDPKKDETLLDPACGTAGFLISSYKHVLANNADDHGNSMLTPDEKARLAANVKGYDISPDMVRLSLVNMYLHDFVDPHIFEYDTLTSEDRWHEYADVILANPPFMSPKGGIRPHNRFSVKSKRSEVLFVDYMAEHLTPSGRAGIIVPEGIIFQSQSAYKQLRKTLVEDYLVAVVSLPAGVFQPYSGVKTSILILDRPLAKRTNHIGFFKVENDGFDLGAQRRPIEKNDLPHAREEIAAYLRRLGMGESLDDFQPKLGLIVEKEKIAGNGDYNLSGERYRESGLRTITKWPIAELREIAREIKAGFACGKGTMGTEGIPHIRPMNITEKGQFTWKGLKRITKEDYVGKEDYSLMPRDVLFNNTNSKELVGKTCLIVEHINGGYSNHMTRIRVNERCESVFLAYILHSAWHKGEFLKRANKWIGQAGINIKSLSEFQIPLPPMQVQREIVAEIKGYQKVIDGARTVVDHYRPHIPIDPDWPMVALGGIAKDIKTGFACGKGSVETKGIPHIRPMNITEDGRFTWSGLKCITKEDYFGKEDYSLMPGDVLFNNTNSKELVGKTCLIVEHINGGYSNHMTRIRVNERCVSAFLAYILHNSWHRGEFRERSNKWIGQAGINTKSLSEFLIHLPPLQVQEKIVAEIETEQVGVEVCRDLVKRFEGKIRKAIGRVWGTDKSVHRLQ